MDRSVCSVCWCAYAYPWDKKCKCECHKEITVVDAIWSQLCPMCDSSDVEHDHPEHEEDNIVKMMRECNRCKCRWYDEFTFTGMSFPDYPDDDPLFI